MKLETGYVYHIKNEFFDFVNDDKLMKNHEGNATRPNYFCIKKDDSNLMWFVPMSSKTEKFRKIMEHKIQKNGRCDTIVIGNYRNRDTAFLIQNMFPITQKYIDHIDTANGETLKVAKETRTEIIEKVNRVFKLMELGVKVIFPDVDKISEKLLNEINKEYIEKQNDFEESKDDFDIDITEE